MPEIGRVKISRRKILFDGLEALLVGKGGDLGDVLIVDTVNGLVKVASGEGSALAKVGGLLEINTTLTGTDADTLEKILITYTLPANTLSVNNKGLKITAWGNTAINGNIKTIKTHFGNVIINDSLARAQNNVRWMQTSLIFRTGAGAQDGHSHYLANNLVPLTKQTTPAMDETNDIIIKVTGKNDVAVANDIVAHGMMVEIIN